mmetsp:Transcript_15575/g.63507  ORF Transcript_15575/g.63507 Transcript_15575/m.63507 type:complete len:109 (+) Transcript_15575:3017-3343(+)
MVVNISSTSRINIYRNHSKLLGSRASIIYFLLAPDRSQLCALSNPLFGVLPELVGNLVRYQDQTSRQLCRRHLSFSLRPQATIHVGLSTLRKFANRSVLVPKDKEQIS